MYLCISQKGAKIVHTKCTCKTSLHGKEPNPSSGCLQNVCTHVQLLKCLMTISCMSCTMQCASQCMHNKGVHWCGVCTCKGVHWCGVCTCKGMHWCGVCTCKGVH